MAASDRAIAPKVAAIAARPAALPRPVILPQPVEAPRGTLEGGAAAPARARAETAARAGRKPAPLHLPIAIGVTAGLYAVSLAGVTALQARADADLAAQRQPLADALDTVTSHRAALEHELRATVDSLNAASGAYGSALDGAESLEAMVASLSRQVGAVSGAASAVRVPSVRLPSAPRTVTVVTSPPATSGTTGASSKP